MMKNFTEYLNEHLLDEAILAKLKSGVHNFFNDDQLPATNKEEMHHGGITVTKLDTTEANQHRFKPHFEPTHTIKIHGVDHIVGKEIGKPGNTIYRKGANGTHTEVSGFRLLHEHPSLTKVKLGHDIHADHKEAFRTMPISGYKGKVAKVMHLDPTSHVGGVSVRSMQLLALRHHSAGPHLIDAALKSQHKVDPIIFKKAITLHGLSRQQATDASHNTHLMSHQYIATSVRDRLTQP